MPPCGDIVCARLCVRKRRYRHRVSLSAPGFSQSDPSNSTNFMRMMFSNPCEEYKANEVLVCALDRILIPHVGQRQTSSTLMVRLAGFSGANPFALNVTRCACLCGIAHCFANEAALNMHEESGSLLRVSSSRTRRARGHLAQ
ncbi:hypothetical protein L5014_20130 [Paraburkholderia sp. RG36]|uniref:Uncharacterized protein n=1 Tax=Paraburkholderia tagetis TaxID=2913261 RepID=A0A9X1UIQ8_9BURK|nr:citrate/2-methylcitrate synthase [Paraburkholderia tagetis]MCG5075653.1 hypothetical protein [Paraburkholderia tagetis]